MICQTLRGFNDVLVTPDDLNAVLVVHFNQAVPIVYDIVRFEC